MYGTVPIGGGCPTPFYLLSHILTSSAVNLNSSCSIVLLSHHAAGGKPEDGFAARKALSPIGVAGTDFREQGGDGLEE